MAVQAIKETTLSLPALHWGIVEDERRFKVVNAGRGFAKTGLLLVDAIWNLERIYKTPDGKVLPHRLCYLAPSLGEARDIAWERAKDLFSPFMDGKPNESRLEIPLINKGKFFLRGTQVPNRLRGDYLTWLGWDECAFAEPQGMTPEEMWQKVLRPMLGKVRPSGRGIFTSTPDGENQFYELFQKGMNANEPDWRSWEYSSIDGGFMSLAEVEAAKKDMSEDAWLQEFWAKFIASAGRVYHGFSDANIKNVQFNRDLPILWAWDFNESPHVHSVLSHEYKQKLYTYDEIAIGYTPNTVEEFMKRYKPDDCQAGIKIYGDANGNHTTTGVSDYMMIEQMLIHRGYPRPEFCVGRFNPHERDRVNAVNGKFKNALNQVGAFINEEKCPKLIRDFKQVKRDDSGKIDKRKDPKLTHASDAYGYMVAWEFPSKWARMPKEPIETRKDDGTFGWWT